MASKKARSSLNGMIPPPPPTIPSGVMMQGILDPSVPPPASPGGFQHALIPQLSREDLDSVLNYQPDPGLDDALTEAKKRMTEASSAADAAAFRSYDLSSAMQNFRAKSTPTEFEQNMKSALQQRMIDALGAENSFSSRFSSGFDMGQKLTANIIGPAIGLITGSPSAYYATQAMKQRVAQSERQRQAERYQANQTLANLASMYDNVDPRSAKNAAASLKAQMDLAKFDLDMKTKAADDLRQATQLYESASNNKNQAAFNAAKTKAELMNALYGRQLEGARLQNDMNKYDAGLANTQADNARADKSLALQEQGLSLRKQEFDRSLSNDRAAGAQRQEAATRDEQKVQMQALDSLRKITDNIRAKMSAVNADGSPKYANYADLLRSDKVLQQVIARYKKLAGFGEMPDEQVMQMIAPPKDEAPADQGGGLDWLGKMGGGFVQNAHDMLFGPQQKNTPKAAPVSVDDAAAFLKGRKR